MSARIAPAEHFGRDTQGSMADVDVGKQALLEGIDVSYCQPHIDWRAVATEKRFAIIKTSQRKPDPIFASHWSGARSVGLLVGCYHYLDPRLPVAEQVAVFLATYRSVDGWADLPPALDVEEAGNHEQPARLAARALEWLVEVESELGVVPMFYTSPGFAAARLRCADMSKLSRFPLWLAHWDVDEADTPWPWESWAIWQRFKGRCSGVRTEVDLNYMRAEAFGLMADAPRPLQARP